MPEFLVSIVKAENLGLWRELHDSKESSDEAKKAGKAGLLGIQISVTARTIAEATAKAERDHPGYVAIHDASYKLG